jgi:glycosyltransferase involved in cell wall biosynthesis
MALSILIFGALLAMPNDGFTVGMLVVFLMFASRVSQPLLGLAGLWHKFLQVTRLKAGDPVITYVARNLEPYRGIHHFLRALAIAQQQHPTCHALIVGGDNISYGRAPKDASSWREKLT